MIRGKSDGVHALYDRVHSMYFRSQTIAGPRLFPG